MQKLSCLCYLLERSLGFFYLQYTNFTRKRDTYYDLPSQREKPVLKIWNLHISVCAVSTMNTKGWYQFKIESSLCKAVCFIQSTKYLLDKNMFCWNKQTRIREKINLKEPSGFQQIAAYKWPQIFYPMQSLSVHQLLCFLLLNSHLKSCKSTVVFLYTNTEDSLWTCFVSLN